MNESNHGSHSINKNLDESLSSLHEYLYCLEADLMQAVYISMISPALFISLYHLIYPYHFKKYPSKHVHLSYMKTWHYFCITFIQKLCPFMDRPKNVLPFGLYYVRKMVQFHVLDLIFSLTGHFTR